MKKIKFMMLLLFLTGAFYHGQVLHDSLRNWMAKFYTLYFQEFSKNGKYIAIKKKYGDSADTLMVFSTEKKEPLIGYTTKVGNAKFFKDDYIMTWGGSKAELWDLKANQKIPFANVKKAVVLEDKNEFLILDNQKKLARYSASNKFIQNYSDVDLVLDDGEEKFWYVKKNGEKTEVWDTIGLLYVTDEFVSKVELSKSGKRLIIYEKNNTNKSQSLAFINLREKKIEAPKKILIPESEYFNVEEIGDGSAYLISSLNSIKPEKAGLVDIWYGTDYNLEDKFQNRAEYKYWIWKPEFRGLQRIPNGRKSNVAQVGSERFFLVYATSKSKDYTTDFYDLTVSIYDAKKKEITPLGELKTFKGYNPDSAGVFGVSMPSVCASKNGDYIISKKEKDTWELMHLVTNKKVKIGGGDLENPVFSSDSRYVFFEGKYDLWKYGIEKGKMEKLGIAKDKNVRIVNIEEKQFSSADSRFYTRYIDLKNKVLLKVLSRDSNSHISYVIWDGKKTKTVLNSSSDLITDFNFDMTFSKFAFIEKKYNKPSHLMYKDLKGWGSDVLFSISDEEALKIKQEIIQYQNTYGKQLKGTLYYPLNFNPNKKYSMVVYIYRIQRRYSNEYKIPKVEDLNIRTLIKRGYFVYLPDIEYGSSGPGLSALDCVNKALDAVSANKNINMSKVGLSGFSMGGYETSFIATKSNRFATYIAGAGSSDLMRAYYSFSYGSQKPYYWRYENQIYELKVPFAANKELYLRNSPIYDVEKVNAPILLWAGKKDDNVPADEVMEFYIGLKRYKKPVVALFYPDQQHSFVGEAYEDYFTRTLQWWDYFLKDKKDVPWIDKEMNMED